MNLPQNRNIDINATISISIDDYNEFHNLKLLSKVLGIDVKNLSKGHLIKLKRSIADMTLTDLSEEAGMDRGHLRKIESNLTTVQESTIIKLEGAFGTDFCEYLRKIL